MPEEAHVDLTPYLGRPVAQAQEELSKHGIEVNARVEALIGPLALLAEPAGATSAPPHSRIVAYTADDRVARFVVDRMGSFRGTLSAQATQIDDLQRRVAALEQHLQSRISAEGHPASEQSGSRYQPTPEQ